MDIKTMVQADGSVGREVPVTGSTDTPNVPGDYHEFQGSQSKMYETYSTRIDKVSAALGNTDSVKS